MLSRTTRADGASSDQARAVYDAGASAYDHQDFREAATQFARADELVPNQAVLRLALAAAVRAEDPVMAMNLVQRAERRAAVDSDLLELLRVTRARFESRVGFVKVRCTFGHTCQAYLADQRLEVGLPIAVVPGNVELRFREGQTESRISVKVVAARTLEVSEPEPAAVSAPAAPVPRPKRQFLRAATESPSFAFPRGVFWGGVALSGALTVATVASGIDAANARAQFLADRNEDTRGRGQAAVERTNVLLGATLGGAVLTGAIGLFFTHWQPVAAHPTGPASSLAIAF
jgi:hypothetical protein